jgi:ankyrin repeat protein
MANKADLQATDMFGRSALHWAAVLAHGDMVQVLLANGADLNARSKGGDTPLHDAAHGGHTNMVEIIKILLANGADINATNPAGGTPLSEVVAAENRSVPPNLPATAVAGLETTKEREKGVADFLRQHGGHE